MMQVTPNFESVPERTYIRTGSTIQCFKVLECIKNAKDFNTIILMPDDPIWLVNLPSEDIAKDLMNDLYYGEYTGG